MRPMIGESRWAGNIAPGTASIEDFRDIGGREPGCVVGDDVVHVPGFAGDRDIAGPSQCGPARFAGL